jgi:basic membrane protein A and related proteins
MIKKRLISMLATVVLASTLFAGCGQKAPESSNQGSNQQTQSADTRKKTDVKVGLSTDAGGKGDKSFNDAAIAGLDKISKEYTVDPVILESKDQNAYSPNLTTLAGQSDLSFAVGFLMQQAATDIAKANPNKKFAIIDSNVDLPNVVSINFKANEGSFLVGVLAGKATKTNKVGFIGGMDMPLIQNFEAGFVAGVESVNPAAAADLLNRKNVKYTGKFDDPSLGKEAASALYNAGCDVVYHAAGSCGLGLLDAAKELRDGGKDVWAIGVDQDQAQTVPKDADAILSSCIKRVDVGTYDVTKSLIEGNFKGGTTIVFGLKEDGVGYAPTKNPKAPAGIYDLADKYKQAIVDGKIVVPGTLDELKGFKPVTVQ